MRLFFQVSRDGVEQTPGSRTVVVGYVDVAGISAFEGMDARVNVGLPLSLTHEKIDAAHAVGKEKPAVQGVELDEVRIFIRVSNVVAAFEGDGQGGIEGATRGGFHRDRLQRFGPLAGSSQGGTAGREEKGQKKKTKKEVGQT